MITVLGSINLDLVATANKLPLPGETIVGKQFSTMSGGKGANQALAALRAGASVRLEGAVGADAFADQALAELHGDRADLGGVDILGETTGIAVILVGGGGENVIVVVPGANGLVTAKKARIAVRRMQPSDIVLLQQEIPQTCVRTALEEARRIGATSILNIAPFTSDTANLARLANIVVANETEFAHLAGALKTGDELIAQVKQFAHENNQILAVTLGADGVIASTAGGTILKIETIEIDPVDTVGAGDTFCGYLAASLDAGLALDAALRRAAIAGSLACLKPGAQPAIPLAKDVDAML